MPVSALEEILEQRRRQKALAEKNAKKAASDRTRADIYKKPTSTTKGPPSQPAYSPTASAPARKGPPVQPAYVPTAADLEVPEEYKKGPPVQSKYVPTASAPVVAKKGPPVQPKYVPTAADLEVPEEYKKGPPVQSKYVPTSAPVLPTRKGPPVQPAYSPTVLPARKGPPVQPAYVPTAADLEVPDEYKKGPPVASKYVPTSAPVVGKKVPPAYAPMTFQYDVAPTTSGLQVGLTGDRPDTGVLPVAATRPITPTVAAAAPLVKPWRGGTKDDEAFPRNVGAVEQKLNEFGAWAAGATGQGDPYTAYQNTPGAQYAALRDKERRADDVTTWDKLGSGLWSGLDQAFTVPGKALETTPIPGLGVSAGQALGVATSAANKVLGSFDRNKAGPVVDSSPGETTAIDWVKEFLPIDALTALWDAGKPELANTRAVREKFEALPLAQQQQANIAGVNIISGSDAWQKSIDAILNQDTSVQSLEAKAREAMTAGDASAAASYGAQAYKLKTTSAADLVDEHTSVLAEVTGGVLLDPTNILPFGVIGDAWKSYRLNKTFSLTSEQGLKNLDGALAKSAQMLEAAGGGPINPREWWQKVNPLARTADTDAHMAADKLFSAAAQMFGQVTTKADAQTLMQAWVTDPARLIQGVTGLTSPSMANQAVDGVYRVGAGSIANKPLLESYPILQVASEKLLNLKSLADEGAFNPLEFMSEVNSAIYDGARRAFGMDVTMPEGAISARVKRLVDGTGVIEYLDKGKNVVETSTPEVFANAQEHYNKLIKNIKGGGGGVYNALRTPDRLQRSIMSDMFLALRPAHWIRNAASATATLLSDGNYSIKAAAERAAYWTAKNGGVVPEAGLFDTLTGAQRGISTQAALESGDENWTRQFWPKHNPYAALVEKGNEIWGGMTELPGSVPFGESAFRLTAFDTAGQRTFRQGWTSAVENTYKSALEGLGIDPAIVGKVASLVTDAGIVGDKAGIANAARKALGSNTIPFNLRDLGIQDELLSLDGWKNLNSYIADGLPDQVDEVADAVSMVFREEASRFGRILNASPPQPGVYEWTSVEQAEDGAEIIDGLVQAARMANIDPAQARQQATKIVQELNATFTGALDTFRQELAQNPQPGALNLAMDTWAQFGELKQAARAEVDGFSKAAIASRTPQAWATKWQETLRIWQEMGPKTQELFDASRNSLLTLGQGGDVPKMRDWWDTVQRYMSYDEQATGAARTAGLGATDLADPAMGAAIDANRQYLDNSVAEVFDAFRRSPTVDSFDLLVSAQKQIDQLGAQAATYLAEKRAALLPKKAGEYRQLANAVWGQFFDNAVVHNNAVSRLIVADGVAGQVASGLRWTDEFAGGEFRLIGQNADGTWQAQRLDDKSMHSFAEAGKGSSALPTVPANILSDFRRATSGGEQILDDVIADIRASRAPTAPTPNPLTRRVVPRFGATKAGKEAAAVQKLTSSVADEAKARAGGMKDARKDLWSEWDRVAVGNWKYPKLDDLVKEFERQGIVNVPDTMFDDLYGNTIAGRRIEGQKDVEAFIEEYAAMKRQADKAGAVIRESGQYKKMGRGKVLQERQADLIEAGYTADDLAKMNRREILDALESIDDVGADEMGVVYYESSASMADFEAADRTWQAANPHMINPEQVKRTGWDPMGLSEGDDLYKVIEETVKKKTGNKAPEMGNVAQHMSERLRRAERTIIDRLPEILAGTPNSLTPGQRLQAVDALNQLLPEFDNVLAKSTQAGKDAMNFAMLNFRDRRNMDTALAMVVPFHYFWTRSAKNWGARVLRKPALINYWHESERAITLENKQQELPDRLQGTLPNPLNQFGIGNERMGNPINWILPFASYMGNEFENPDEAQGEFERRYLQWKKWTPGLLPALQYVADSTFDKTQPKEDGTKRTDSYQVGDYVPMYRMAGYLKQMLTGENLPQAGDEWDEYRTVRQLSEDAQAGADPNTARYAQQISKNKEAGRPDGENIPPEIFEAAYALYIEGSKGSAGDKLETLVTGYTTGNATYNYNPEEQALNKAKGEYGAAGYDQQTNLFGSKEAKNAIKENNPALPVAWARYDEAPGVTAQYDEAKALGDTLWDAGGAGVDALLAKNPDAKKADIYAARLDAVLKQASQVVGAPAMAEFTKTHPEATPAEIIAFVKNSKFPNADEKEFPDGIDRYKGMNPEERKKAVIENIIMTATTDLEEPVYPGDDASKEAKAAYYKAVDEFKNSKRQNAIDRITQTSGDAERGRLEVDAETAGRLYDEYQKRNMTDAEAERVTEINADQAVTSSFSDNWTEYKKLKGADKAEYLRNNPEFADYYLKEYPENGAWWSDDSTSSSSGEWSDEWTAYKALSGKAKKQYMLDNPKFANMYAEEYLDGKDPWWLSEGGGGSGGGGGGQWSDEWTEYKALSGKAKKQYMLDNPEFANMYASEYLDGKDPWWLGGGSGGSGGGGSSGGQWSDEWESYKALSGKAKKQYMLDNPGFANMYAEEYLNGKDPWWLSEGGGGSGGGGRQAGGGGSGGGGQWSDEWESYKSLSGKAKKQYMLDNPGFANMYAEEYLDGKDPWWLSEGGGGSGGGGRRTGGGGSGGGGQWSDEWTAYKALSGKAKKQYMLDNPGFADMYASEYMNGKDPWWLDEGGGSSGRSGGDESGDFEAAGQSVSAEFGAEGLKAWNQYYALDDRDRDAYKLAHPELKAFSMAGYNPEEYAEAKELFGADAWSEWALIPATDGSDEAKAARSAYLDAHPQAKLLQAWVNGRPGNFDESAAGDEFAYNFGADFAQAESMFGDDIWGVWAGYSSSWDKPTKKAYHEQFPNLSPMMDWWYGGSTGSSTVRAQRGAGSAYGGGGGGYSSYGGGGGGGGGEEQEAPLDMMRVDPRYLARDLEVEAPKPWRGKNFSADWWLKSADRTGPEKMQEWRPRRQY